MLITIDGYSCQGKSYFGEQIAQKMGLSFFSTGLLVRFIAYHYGRSEKRDTEPMLAIQNALGVLEKTDIDDIILMENLRQLKTERYLKEISQFSFIMPALQRKLKSYVYGKNILLDGRYTFYIFPEADRKYYFRSTIENRISLVVRAKGLSYKEARAYVLYRDSFEEEVVVPNSVTIIDPFAFSKDSLVDYLLKDIQR